jgi:hypothetical protein
MTTHQGREVSRDQAPSGGGRTEIAVTVKGRKEPEVIALELGTMLTQAEQEGGDPIRALMRLVQEALAGVRLALTTKGRSALERALSQGATAMSWPARLTLEGEAFAPPERGRDTTPNGKPRSLRSMPPHLFEEHRKYPDPRAAEHLAALIGLEAHVSRATKEAVLLLNPGALKAWAKQHHSREGGALIADLQRGSPLLIFTGDVGTGKTALAESLPDAIAKTVNAPVHLYRLSIRARGTGLVGQMSQQISDAFTFVEQVAKETGQMTILLLDEADSLASSREGEQMHHEDRAGVNALIQGIDRLRHPDVPAMVIFCTNRGDALDPAIRRRAAHQLSFPRPTAAQRRRFFETRFGKLGLSGGELDHLSTLTGPGPGRAVGYTFSDLTDRLLRTAVLEAYPNGPVTFALLSRLAAELEPTPPFGGN